MSYRHGDEWRESMACPCMRCGTKSTLDTWEEADVGVGVITGAYVWDCPKCGLFDESGRFQQDEPPGPNVELEALGKVFGALAASAGGVQSHAYQIADMNVFRA